MNILDVVQMLAKYADLVQFVIDAVESKGVPQDALVNSVKLLMEEASDAQMHKEFPEG